MLHIAMTAAHGGYDSEQVPLGGAAAVCERLCRLWAGRSDVQLSLVGSGPCAPPGVRYFRAGGLGDQLPSALNEWDYAAFCKRFEDEATDWLLQQNPRPIVLSHDISESPNFTRLRRAGVDCLCVLHVDVVDYFQRFYLGDRLPASWWARAYRQLRGLPWPHVLQLVFEKQELAAERCRHMIVPSEPMKRLLLASYPHLPEGRVQVVPWGAPEAAPPRDLVEKARLHWEALYPGTLMTCMSRISPEKGQHIVLEGLLAAEARGEVPDGVTLVVAGAPAYMQGKRYEARLRSLAARLRRVKVVFPGHLGGPEKHGLLERTDVFLVASRHESYGLTIMEALAAGCAVVATRSFGTEATLDAGCGVMVESGRGAPDRLIRAALNLLRHPEKRAELGIGALARAEGQTFDKAAERLLVLCRGQGEHKVEPVRNGKASDRFSGQNQPNFTEP